MKTSEKLDLASWMCGLYAVFLLSFLVIPRFVALALYIIALGALLSWRNHGSKT